MTVTTPATPMEQPEETNLGNHQPVDETLSEDVIFHILQNERRRLVLEYLQDCEGQVRMRDVAEQVAAWEHDTTVQQLTSKQRQRVYIPLYQNHLTKLDEEGIIDYDQSRGIVERRSLANQLDPYLGRAEETEEDDAEAPASTPWERYYLGTSILGTVLVTGKAFGVSVLSSVPGSVIGVLILAAFSLVTLLQISAPYLHSLE